ncbi:AraC family transcriptional regulator [Pseudalgibacter alginicilyticus]|uniref:AraC family transcriptional regulator n=1 Tax=Pseudalgibacter alginicilyticus TaxID=1736674 RepID=A0A0N7HYC2_9FLAO|nr:helix-turn-helix transcriptional regulator [Pseudalgibacter alginicilyticus]ALJ04846.1 AraC family transcriptional regulator [Pseudalgibacter alginicilyticus]
MMYKEINPSRNLQNQIHSYWEIRGDTSSNHWERIFPDGCPGLIMNLGDNCTTDNGTVKMEHGKTYLVGAMTTFKESYINENTHLIGVCLKPSAFASFFSFTSLSEIKNNTILFDKNLSFDRNHFFKDNYTNYLNQFFTDRKSTKSTRLSSVIDDIRVSRGSITIEELSKQNVISTRQLERLFNNFIGLTPKEYANIIRLQYALNLIASQKEHKSFSDIAFECGYYDHSHLTNAVKRHTGYLPSLL